MQIKTLQQNIKRSIINAERILESNKNMRIRKMNTVQVKNTVIGEGRPKICVPIVGKTKTDILEEAKKITTLPVDVVEWRVDWFDDVFAN